jgi:hypothetical protein
MAELASKSCSCIVSCSGFDRKYRLLDSERHLAAAGEISNQEQKIYLGRINYKSYKVILRAGRR